MVAINRMLAGTRRLIWVPVVVALTLGTAYSLVAWWSSTRVPSGVTVADVEIGGRSERAAARALQDGLTDAASRPVTVVVDGAEKTIDPGASGLAVDVPATVDEVVGFSWDPRVVWRQFSGEEQVAPVRTVDTDALEAAVQGVADEVDTEPADGTITFSDGAPVATPAVRGVAVDVPAATRTVAEEWLTGKPSIQLPADVTPPAIEQSEVDEVMESFAVPATSGPVTVAVGQRTVVLEPAQLATALAVTATDGELVPSVVPDLALAALVAADPSVQTVPTDATVTLRKGRPVVVPAVTGLTVDPAALSEALRAAIDTPERAATVDAVAAEPEVTTAEAEALGIKEVVSQFSTNLTADSGRTENIAIAARTVNGTLLLPGETFSLNETLGERTAAKGYNEAPVIMNGKLTKGTGGGVSQVATTLFNGMFFAGLKDVEHKPHSFYISRYPEGREATVNYPTVDLKFTNDSGYGVLIEMNVSGGKVNTRFWSTKVWEIEATKGPRTNVKAPGVDTGSGPGCVAQSPQSGFDVSVKRIFSRRGTVARTETFKTRYIPEDKITCTP